MNAIDARALLAGLAAPVAHPEFDGLIPRPKATVREEPPPHIDRELRHKARKSVRRKAEREFRHA